MRFSAILWVLTSAVLGWGALESAAQPKTLRVCADRDYLPYSNRAGQGFENKIAQAVAKALGTTVEYTSKRVTPKLRAESGDACPAETCTNVLLP